MGSRYGLQVRAAAAADAPGLAELFAACGLPDPPGRLAARLEAFDGGVALLAAEWGPPSGLVAVTWARSLLCDAPVATLDALLVAPEDRRRGIGRLLLKAASQAARQAGCDELRAAAGEGGSASDLASFLAATGFSQRGASHVRPLRRRG